MDGWWVVHIVEQNRLYTACARNDRNVIKSQSVLLLHRQGDLVLDRLLNALEVGEARHRRSDDETGAPSDVFASPSARSLLAFGHNMRT